MKTADRRGGSSRDVGSMSVELVILFPLLVAFTLLVVACGRYVAVRGDIEAASRDAARAASLERTRDAAEIAADGVAAAALEHPERCQRVDLSGAFTAGGTITATVTCDVSYDGLGLIGIPGSKRLSASSSAPLDTYRRTG